MPSPSELQEICSCFGQPVAGNPTQYMMERAFEHHGLDWRYLTLEVAPEQLGDAVRGMRAMGFRGGNITKPHKVEVIQYLDGTTEAAGLMGAVNCIFREDGKLRGENTDGKGFLQSLRELEDPKGKRVIVLGAGGAARAIAVELGLAGAAQVDIANRSEEKGRELAELLKERVKTASSYLKWDGDIVVPEGTEVLINATSIGLFDSGARVPLDGKSLRKGMIAADVIFSPPDTKFLQEAKKQGCRTLDGLGMLVNQAVISFEIWTGVKPEAEVMRDALEEFLGI